VEICLQGPGKSWNLLGNDVHGSFWFQIDVFLQTNIVIIVASRYVFWVAGMPESFHGPCDPSGGTYKSPQDPLAAVWRNI